MRYLIALLIESPSDLSRYAEHHKVTEHIRFNSEVVKVRNVREDHDHPQQVNIDEGIGWYPIQCY